MNFDHVGELRDPLLIAAFEGWNDAGDAASGAIAYLREVLLADEVGEIDPEDYYDFQVNRPHVSVDEKGVRRLSWPTTRIFVARGDRDLILVQGIEPSLRWRSFVHELLAVSLDLGATSALCMGALLADTPHTRAVPVHGTSTDAAVSAKLGLEPSHYEGPTGIVGVIMDQFAKAGVDVTSVWASVPHYVAAPPNPKATLALLETIAPILGTHIPLGNLRVDAHLWQDGVDEFAAEDEEIAEYVTQLEEVRDTADSPEASGDAIAAEFERYLRGTGDA